MGTTRRSPGERLIRLALRAFPASFRRHYADDLLAAHADQIAACRSAPARLHQVARTMASITSNGLAERAGQLRSSLRQRPTSREVSLLMSNFHSEVLRAVRALLRQPRFTVAGLLCLGLGLGGVIVMFSLVRGIVLDPLPFPRSEQLVRVYDTFAERGQLSSLASPANFADWRERQRGVRLAAWNPITLTYTGVSPAEPVTGALVTAEFFAVLGHQPVLGRGFTRAEEEWGAHHVVVLGHGFWMRQFGGDPAVVGRTISLEGSPVTVVGVMPAGFAFPSEETQLWRPLAYDFDVSTSRGVHYLYVIGRLDDGQEIGAAETLLQTVMGQLVAAFPERLEGWGVRMVSLQEALIGASRERLYLMFGAVGLVLLIAVVNVTNLMMARAVTRGREMALRVTMGARRWHVLRQLMTEGLVLAGAAAGVGLLLAWALLRVILPAAAGNLPRLGNVALDGGVVGFALILTVIIGTLLGLAPAFFSRSDLRTALADGGHRSGEGRAQGRLRRAFVVAQVALAVMLAVGAGLLLRSYAALVAVDPGYHAEQAVVATVGLPGSRYPDGADRARFFTELVDRLDAVPGVAHAAVSTQIPLEGYGINFSYWIAAAEVPPEGERPAGDFRVVSPEYFQAMGIPVLQGRVFNRQDTEGQPSVIVIDESLARRHFGDGEAVGQRMFVSYGDARPREIIGVVGDVRQRGLASPAEPGYYLPLSQESWSSMRVIVVSSTTAPMLAQQIRQEVAALDPLLSVRDLRTLAERFERSVSSPRLNTMLLGLFAAIAVTLAAAGIYSVMSYVVTRHTHEIGVRIALGAPPAQVRRRVVRDALVLVGAGAVGGMVGALALTQIMEALLFGVSATDPLTFVAAALGFLAVAWCGSYLPARRASRVDPMIALRSD